MQNHPIPKTQKSEFWVHFQRRVWALKRDFSKSQKTRIQFTPIGGGVISITSAAKGFSGFRGAQNRQKRRATHAGSDKIPRISHVFSVGETLKKRRAPRAGYAKILTNAQLFQDNSGPENPKKGRAPRTGKVEILRNPMLSMVQRAKTHDSLQQTKQTPKSWSGGVPGAQEIVSSYLRAREFDSLITIRGPTQMSCARAGKKQGPE